MKNTVYSLTTSVRLFDFQQELLWNGEDLEVLAPTWLRKELAGKIKKNVEQI